MSASLVRLRRGNPRLFETVYEAVLDQTTLHRSLTTGLPEYARLRRLASRSRALRVVSWCALERGTGDNGPVRRFRQVEGEVPGALRELISAGEPLNPEVIEQVRAHWGITIRDGFGQTEMTAVVANSPGQPIKDGAMGRPLPGCPIVLIDPATGAAADEGEICIDVSQAPTNLMVGYVADAERNAEAFAGGYYHTGDIATRDEDGYLTYVGRTDDIFKASDYKISPFELESVLVEHPSVVEAAIVPARMNYGSRCLRLTWRLQRESSRTRKLHAPF